MSIISLYSIISDGYQIAAIIAAVAMLAIGLSLLCQAIAKFIASKTQNKLAETQRDKIHELLKDIYNFKINMQSNGNAPQTGDSNADVEK